MTQTMTLLTTKRVARLPELTLISGESLLDVPIGFETYGRLNSARDNAVLVCHYFSGTSHAAGRYHASEPIAGWWDAVIGPGKAVDTDRWFVVAIDALGCIRTDAPHGVTAGPACIAGATGKPYGPDFPNIDIADMVSAQRQVLDQLGVGKLAAILGPSLGAMQALEWSVRRPDEVARVVACIGLTALDAREHGLYHAMESAIRLDPLFNHGHYLPDAPPLRGLAIAVELMLMLAGGREVAGAPDKNDAGTFEAWLARETQSRALGCDANAMIAMLRTNTRWRLGGVPLAEAANRIQARLLLLPSQDDALLPPANYHAPLASALAASGVDYAVQMLPPGYGHLGGLYHIGDAASAIRQCLETPRDN
jgi:homoserine O-acetyltransferase